MSSWTLKLKEIEFQDDCRSSMIEGGKNRKHDVLQSDKVPGKVKKKSEQLRSSAVIFIISQFLASYLQFTSNAVLTGKKLTCMRLLLSF